MESSGAKQKTHHPIIACSFRAHFIYRHATSSFQHVILRATMPRLAFAEEASALDPTHCSSRPYGFVSGYFSGESHPTCLPLTCLALTPATSASPPRPLCQAPLDPLPYGVQADECSELSTSDAIFTKFRPAPWPHRELYAPRTGKRISLPRSATST